MARGVAGPEPAGACRAESDEPDKAAPVTVGIKVCTLKKRFYVFCFLHRAAYPVPAAAAGRREGGGLQKFPLESGTRQLSGESHLNGDPSAPAAAREHGKDERGEERGEEPLRSFNTSGLFSFRLVREP